MTLCDQEQCSGCSRLAISLVEPSWRGGGSVTFAALYTCQTGLKRCTWVALEKVERGR